MFHGCSSFKTKHTEHFSQRSAYHLLITVVALCWFPSSFSVSVRSQDTQTWTQYSRCVSAKCTKLACFSLMMWCLCTSAPNHISFHGILQTRLICCPLSLDLSGIPVFWILHSCRLLSLLAFFFPLQSIGVTPVCLNSHFVWSCPYF